MAHLVDCVSIAGLKPTHFRQLLWCVERNYAYYGNRDQFYKREHELRDWLREIIRYVSDDGIIIPDIKRTKGK